MASKNKWYVVWRGINPGIYETWAECKAQITGVENAKYKSFETLVEAQKAFREGAQTIYSKSKNSKFSQISRSKIIIPSLSVDAACSGNPGLMEYRGVKTSDGTEIFRKGPFKEGTNNVGEFLGLVHGLALMKHWKKEDVPIYTDSKTAMAWVRNKKVKTTLKKTKDNEILFELMSRAEKWLRENTFRTPIYKWETKSWGEIPADFGRK